jgi:hypothetical protein
MDCCYGQVALIYSTRLNNEFSTFLCCLGANLGSATNNFSSCMRYLHLPVFMKNYRRWALPHEFELMFHRVIEIVLVLQPAPNSRLSCCWIATVHQLESQQINKHRSHIPHQSFWILVPKSVLIERQCSNLVDYLHHPFFILWLCWPSRSSALVKS